jgi:hypothetical protein
LRVARTFIAHYSSLLKFLFFVPRGTPRSPPVRASAVRLSMMDFLAV